MPSSLTLCTSEHIGHCLSKCRNLSLYSPGGSVPSQHAPEPNQKADQARWHETEVKRGQKWRSNRRKGTKCSGSFAHEDASAGIYVPTICAAAGLRCDVGYQAGYFLGYNDKLLTLLAYKFYIQKQDTYIYTATTCSRNSNAGMLDIAMLSVLAGLGAGGLFRNNCNRDIMRLLRQTVVHFQLSYFTIPLKVTVKMTAGAVMQAIMLPHVLFSTLYHHYPSTWRKRICPSSEVLVEFWQAAENHPQMKDHPLLSQENYQEKTIPLAMHGVMGHLLLG